MPEYVYVVYGSTTKKNTFNNVENWAVRVFQNKVEADEFVDKVRTRYIDLLNEYGGFGKIPDGANEYDRKMKINNYEQTIYYYEAVPLGGVIETDDINIEGE